MMILANVLALVLIAADEPKLPQLSLKHDNNAAAQELWQMTLPEAIRIGLDNSEVIRVITPGMPNVQVGGSELTSSVKNLPANSPRIAIARLNADASVWNFKSAVMAHVRSIEQQYWALSYLQVNLWARETAVKLGEEILRRERAELAKGRATKADVAEAEQQLENFRLNLVSATSDVFTTERQLRNILGLPSSDNRRIIACSAPIETKLEPNWEESLASMSDSQPDIVQQRSLVGLAELKALIEGENPLLPAERRDASKVQLARQQEFLQQIVRQTTHSLARFFLELDSGYKQYQTAQKLREAAQHRLEAQRAFYEEGRVTIDRLLDAVSQYANAISQEAQYKSTYNTAIAAFEEAKGTLLARDQITVAEGPTLRGQHLPTPVDQGVAPASFTMPTQTLAPVAPVAPVAPPVPVAPAAPVALAPAPVSIPTPAPAPVKAQPTATTYRLKATFGVLKGLEVELEVTPSPK